MRGIFVLILLPLIGGMLSGCVGPAELSAPAGWMYDRVVYEVVVRHDSAEDVVQVTLGAPVATTTFYPDGLRREALIRSFNVGPLLVDESGPSSEMISLFGTCQEGDGFCASAVALEPGSLVPFRVFLAPLEHEELSDLDDGSLRSLYWSDRADVGFWPISPFFVPHATAQGGLDVLFGRAVDSTFKGGRDGSSVEFSAKDRWVDPADGTEVRTTYRAQVQFEDALDPVRGSARYKEEVEGEITRIDYAFKVLERGERVKVPSLPPSLTSGPSGEPCGADLERILLPESAYRYPESFAAVQADSRFRDRGDGEPRMLVRIDYRVDEQRRAPGMTETKWEYSVFEGANVAVYVVEQTSVISEDLPTVGEYRVVDRREEPSDAVWTTLAEHKCVGFDGVGDHINSFLGRHGADGHAQALIQTVPSFATFRDSGAGLAPEAGAYKVMIRPFLTDASGHRLNGPHMHFSLVTGNLTMIW